MNIEKHCENVKMCKWVCISVEKESSIKVGKMLSENGRCMHVGVIMMRRNEDFSLLILSFSFRSFINHTLA